MSLCIAFLTGQSNRRSCALSPVQAQFLDQLNSKGIVLQATNFPYDESPQAFTKINLIQASVSNARQYLASRRLSFSEQHSQQVLALINRYSKVLFLVGSCGLELLNNLHLPADMTSRVEVLAYGPVAKSAGCFKLTTVQGKQDYLSRLYFSEVDHRIESGHMDYLQSADFLTITRAKIASMLLGNDVCKVPHKHAC